MQWRYTSYSPEDTRKLGLALGRVLTGGDVVCLRGGLGAGKTALAQGIGEGLGLGVPVTSPTFTLIQEYHGRIAEDGPEKNRGEKNENERGVKEGKEDRSEDFKVVHMDFYRLTQPQEAEVIGVSDFFQEDTLVLIEWPDIIEDILPAERLDIRIEGDGEEPRRFTLSADSDEWVRRWQGLGGGIYEVSGN
ncbi:tRNA threonylcarbamoyladenosine biosynthesis protein TsaE [Peptococcaceae bacterium CEB3]|nr:tRNA threonylcarbamoyladenosine biosynthesis protein TsaE [Peptococcaceae bacterium CEB3]